MGELVVMRGGGNWVVEVVGCERGSGGDADIAGGVDVMMKSEVMILEMMAGRWTKANPTLYELRQKRKTAIITYHSGR